MSLSNSDSDGTSLFKLTHENSFPPFLFKSLDWNITVIVYLAAMYVGYFANICYASLSMLTNNRNENDKNNH